MEKQLHSKQTHVTSTAPSVSFPLRSETPKKNVKVFDSLDAAFAAFDSLEEHDGRMEFVLRSSASETVQALPEIPKADEIREHLMRNALLLVDAGEFSLAQNVLGDVLRKNSNDLEAIRWMGWCFKQQENLPNAQKCYEQLVQIRVTEQDLFELGEIYYSLKKDNEALGTWLEALGQSEAESPRLFDLHKNLGNVFTRLGDYDSAEENYNKALGLRPHSDVLQVNLGSLNFQRRFYRTSLEHFKKAVELNPFNDRGWCGVALVAREMQDVEWAQSVLLKSLDINPFNLTSLQVLTNWSQIDGKFDEAVVRVQTYVNQYQDDAEMIYTLAGLHFQAGDLLASEIELSRLEVLQPGRKDVKELKCLIEQKRNSPLTA